MKTSKQLPELTLEELQEKSKKLKTLLIGFAVAWTIIIGISIGLAIVLVKQGKVASAVPLLISPMLCLTTMLPIIIIQGKVKEEIKTRHHP